MSNSLVGPNGQPILDPTEFVSIELGEFKVPSPPFKAILPMCMMPPGSGQVAMPPQVMLLAHGVRQEFDKMQAKIEELETKLAESQGQGEEN